MEDGAPQGGAALPELPTVDVDLTTLKGRIRWAMASMLPKDRRPDGQEPIKWTVPEMAALINSGYNCEGVPVREGLAGGQPVQGGPTPKERKAYFKELRATADRAALDLPRRRRTHGITMEEVVEALDYRISVGWMVRLEGSKGVWKPEIAADYARLLRLDDDQLVRFWEHVDYARARPSWYRMAENYLQALADGEKTNPGPDAQRTLGGFFMLPIEFFDARQTELGEQIVSKVNYVNLMNMLREAMGEIVVMGRGKLPPKTQALYLQYQNIVRRERELDDGEHGEAEQ